MWDLIKDHIVTKTLKHETVHFCDKMGTPNVRLLKYYKFDNILMAKIKGTHELTVTFNL